MRLRAAALPAGAVLVHALPAVSARAQLHRALPGLYGVGRAGGVALTFDDGPDPVGTPAVLAGLAELGWAATFFLLGSQVRAFPALARRLVDEGHEVAVHGDAHTNHLFRGPRSVADDVGRARDAVAEATGVAPAWFRPPYGVLSAGSLAGARRCGLTPVLWTAWGRDWRPTDAGTVAGTVCRRLRDGGTVLLHDSDCTSTPGSWRATVGSLPLLAERFAARGWQVRTLGAHLGRP